MTTSCIPTIRPIKNPCYAVHRIASQFHDRMQYSAFLLAGILRNIVFPLAVASSGWLCFSASGSWIIWTLACILSVLLNYFLLAYISLVKQHFDARRLHPAAVPIPRVGGKWPLNIDILMDWMGTSKNEYLGEGMVSRLQAIYGQTLNTRILGEDSVCAVPGRYNILHVMNICTIVFQIITTSAEHVSQILTSSFSAFEKGPKWKERVYEMMGNGVFVSDGNTWKHVRFPT